MPYKILQHIREANINEVRVLVASDYTLKSKTPKQKFTKIDLMILNTVTRVSKYLNTWVPHGLKFKIAISNSYIYNAFQNLCESTRERGRNFSMKTTSSLLMPKVW